MKTSASVRKFLHSIYGYAFFNKLLLISPVYAVFMQDHGMSDNMVYMLMCLTMGLSASLGSWRYSMLTIGMIQIGIGLWALLFIKNRCSIKPKISKGAIKTPRQIGSDIV